MIIKLIIFITVSIVVVAYSWNCLRNPRTHGFYRFFAFEAILVLILLNIDYWIKNPFSMLQIISWICLIYSLFLVFQGFILLRAAGKPEGNFENTTELVAQGIYKYIRHPLYGSLLFLAWGAFFKNVTLPTIMLVLIATVSLILTAKVEEQECVDKFGNSYAAYIKQTKMFVPFVF